MFVIYHFHPKASANWRNFKDQLKLMGWRCSQPVPFYDASEKILSILSNNYVDLP